MDLVRAREVLGVTYDADAHVLRAAYLELVRSVHPDVSDRHDASERTSEASEAYQSLLGANTSITETAKRVKERNQQQRINEQQNHRRPHRGVPGMRPVTRLKPRKKDVATITLAANFDEVFPIVVELGHEVGDVTYVEPGSGLVQTLVQFVEAPPCYVVMTARPDGSGLTDISVTVESLNSTPAPDVDAVTDLLVERVRSLKW